jgi:hypothetical protein
VAGLHGHAVCVRERLLISTVSYSHFKDRKMSNGFRSTARIGISLRACVDRSRVALVLAGAALLLSACGGGG